MATNDPATTELFTRWSSVVHQPSEDLEESELPSTVDIGALNSNLTIDSNNTGAGQNENSDSESDSEADSSNSGSEASQSCSQSNSSDSESSSSSPESSSRSPSPEFSVTSSQTNGLRLTIATVRKTSPVEEKIMPKPSEKPTSTNKNQVKSSASSGECSSDSDSESDPNSKQEKIETNKNVGNSKSDTNNGTNNKNSSAKNVNSKDTKKLLPVRTRSSTKIVEKNAEKNEKKNGKNAATKSATTKIRRRRAKKMASLPLSRGSPYSSSDSEESEGDILASCSLQEIREEDLAAILPDQNECNDFNDFESKNDKNSPATGDMSGSDMELPQQAINSLIQRTTESSSEGETHAPPNPSTLYANSLLQQFVAQTQMLNAPCPPMPSVNDNLKPQIVNKDSTDTQSIKSEASSVKRRRGRPKKVGKVGKVLEKSQDFCTNPNVSPDSGIQNSPDHVSSPEPSPSPNIKQKTITHKEEISKRRSRTEEKISSKQQTVTRNIEKNNTTKKVLKVVSNNSSNNNSNKTKEVNNSNNNKVKDVNKISVTSNKFDRVLCANSDKILYPPRRKASRSETMKKGPGRPPKNRNNITDNSNKPNEKPTNNNNSKKGNNRVVNRSRIQNNNAKNKSEPKSKPCTFKIPKVMHSKHKHKHRKRKFKILKPLCTADPKISLEIEKLTADFIKLCAITIKQPKETVTEQVLKNIKKVTKKRKTTEYAEKKKKKQNVNTTVSNKVTKVTNTNEQRLPLKKRHYHLLSNSENTNKTESKTDEVKSVPENSDSVPTASTTTKPEVKPEKNHTKIKTATITNTKVDKVKNVPIPPVAKNVPVAPVAKNVLVPTVTKNVSVPTVSKNVPVSTVAKNVPVSTVAKNVPVPTVSNNNNKSNNVAASLKTQIINNNNDYDVKESIKKSTTTNSSHIDEAIEACIIRFADSKNGKVEEPSNPPEDKEDKINTTTPKKRHRLENNNVKNHVSVQKEAALEKTKKDETTKVNSSPIEATLEKIKPKITIESFINELKIKRNLMQKSSSKDNLCSLEPETITSKPQPKEEPSPAPQIKDDKVPPSEVTPEKRTVEPETIVKVSPESAKKKVRKRRAINRTGFPTLKKKKKKIVLPIETVSGLNTPEIEETNNLECERVPKHGEEYTKFVERSSESQRVPKQVEEYKSIERSSEKVEEISLEKCVNKMEDMSNKWELLSDCESLPLDERIEFDLDEVKSERMTLRQRDISPATSVDTKISRKRRKYYENSTERERELSLESSIERLKSRLELKRRLRSKDVETSSESSVTPYPKRRRDISPASSIEPLREKRVKEERSTSASGDEIKKGSKKVPRWRKKYLVAGLFSDYYKEDDETARIKRQENAKSSRLSIYNPEDHPYGLLPPPYHCGKYLRCRKVDFQLPYDLWWQHTHSQLPGRDLVPSWNYRKIRTNVYNVRNNGGACEPQSCNCKPSTNCGDDCINRLVLSECPATHRCQNQKIQRHHWAPGIEKFMTVDKGWGVRTKEPIKSGDFILEYVGEVVSDQEFKERMHSLYLQDTHHYCLHLDGGLVIDGHRMGSDGRFVNHSCQPNCEMQKWSVNGQFRMALFALRNIEAGEELTYDYNFSLFNPAEGQKCKCGSTNCRGVIGGKSQRIRQLPEPTVTKNPGRVGRPRKTEAKKKPNAIKEVQAPPPVPQIIPQIQVKPMSHQQKCFILEHHCFLLRNLTKVRKVRDRSVSVTSITRQQTATPTDTSAFMNQLNALQKPRNIKTRRIAQVEDDPELNKTVKVAAILKEIWTVVTTAKDENGSLLSTGLMQMPSKRKVPEFYQRITDPIDLSMIEQNIATGVYKEPSVFDEDMNKLFSGYMRFYGRTSDMGISTAKLKKIFLDTKQKSLAKFEDVLGEKPPPMFVVNRKKNQDEEEDIIRCICGIPRDEGLMIQCERCMVWQHTECVKADTAAPSYHCEKCVPRKVDYEIPMDEFTEHGHRYYMTLMRGDLQLRQGDTVYVLRDIPIPGTDRKHTYDTIEKIEYSELDIFRIERLWKDKDNGKRFAYGHHYLRPHETFHEPTRKFFPNEVMRVPLYEAVPVELVISHCWVMDINTYCKGRPIGAAEDHIYICEYRVDKSAKMFSKAAKSKFPVCTKTFAFERFETRLKISRTYCPHDVDEALMKGAGRKKEEKPTTNINVKEVVNSVPTSCPVIVRTPAQQKARLNKILLNLLSKMPTKQILDISYLLEGGRRRKKHDLVSNKEK